MRMCNGLGGALAAAQRLVTWWAMVESPFSTTPEQDKVWDLSTQPLNPVSKGDTTSNQKQTFLWLVKEFSSLV